MPVPRRPYGAPGVGDGAAGGGVRVPDCDDRRLEEERTPCSALGETSSVDALEGDDDAEEGVPVSDVSDGDGDGDLARGELFERVIASASLPLL